MMTPSSHPCPSALALVVMCVPLLAIATGRSPAQLDRRGLTLWLDAADASTLETVGDAAIVRWQDKSGAAHDALASDDAARPMLVPNAMGGRPVVRFQGAQHLTVPAIRPAIGPAAIFIVSQRLPEHANEVQWQRLLSITAPGNDRDNRGPGLAVVEPGHGKPEAYGPIVREIGLHRLSLSELVIGKSSIHDGQHFSGDIAEILIYDRLFSAEESIVAILDYLAEKWAATPTRTTEGWTRVGPLGQTPEHVRDDLPLSDQGNRGNWRPVPEAWDDFDGPYLDAGKWTPHMWYWKGRPPAYFNPANATVHDGFLNLTMRKQELPAMAEMEQYHTYTSAVVISTRRFGYGYYEVRSKPMDSAGSSSFWFQNTGIPGYHTEIDVYEIGGKAPGFEYSYNMNLHVKKKEINGAEYSDGGKWVAPFRLADDFHVYALEWDEHQIAYYVDGVPVRRVPNKDCHEPMLIIFDSETMPNWFGIPKDEDLPSTYQVDYIRAWRRRAAEQD